jgi:hypothetical protein
MVCRIASAQLVFINACPRRAEIVPYASDNFHLVHEHVKIGQELAKQGFTLFSPR